LHCFVLAENLVVYILFMDVVTTRTILL